MVSQSLKDGGSPFHGEDKEQWGQGELGKVLSQYKKKWFFTVGVPWNHHSLGPSFPENNSLEPPFPEIIIP